MRHLGVCLLFGAAVTLGWVAPAFAQAGGPELKTDDTYFPGEGALSTPAKVIQHANAIPRGTVGTGTDREKFIRLFLWRAEHYTHLYSPAVYNLPNITPDPSADNGLMTDYDAMRTLFSYGWGVCGTNHGQMRVFADQAGWPSRRRGLNGDTGYEILIDGEWRYCNTDQYTLHFLTNSPTAHFASVDQIVNTNHHYAEWNPDPGLGYHLPQANTHGGYHDYIGITGTVPFRSNQWQSYYDSVWKPNGNWKMYGEGFTATPVVVRLRRGETFTRWLGPDGAKTDLALSGRAWWGYNGGDVFGGGDQSPYSKYSFVHNAPARDQTSLNPPEESAKVGQRYGNGCFLWQPSLSANEHLDGAVEVTGSLTTGGSPALKSTNASTLVLSQYTPYTIAATPGPNLHPTTGKVDPAQPGATEGAVISADAVGSVGVEVSVNAGATWASIGSLSGAGAKIDFTDKVKGRNQYLLRLSFDNGEGLNSLSLRTVTVMNQAVYPTLKSGTANVTYSTTNTGVLELSPDLWSAASATSVTGYVQKVADSGNVTGDYYATGTYAYNSTNSNPISVTYKITMPPALVAAGATWKQIFAAGNYRVAVPPNATGHYGQIEVSPNNSTWTKIGEHLPPNDNELSHFWAYGKSADATTLGGTTYYVKYTTANGGFPSSIRYLRLAATYTVPSSTAPVEVTYGWNNGAAQTNVHTVAAGAGTDSWSITTGTVASQTKVAIRVGANTATPTAPLITTQPANQTVTAGQTATFSVTATGSAPLQYQWTKNGTTIAGATSASYTTPPTTNADNGAVFRVTVTNGAGSVLSAAASLIVNPAPPPAGATTVTLQQGTNGYAGTVDTYIDEFVPAGSFGNLDRMEIRYYDPGTGLTEHMIGLLKFDLSSIPTTATVTSAKLTLYNTRANSNSASDVLVLDKVTSAWNDTITWSMGVPTGVASGVTCPSLAPYTGAPNPPETFVITTGMGALVQGWVNNPGSNLGMKFSCATNLNIRFGTSEFSFPQYRPALEITYSTGGAPPADTTPPTMTITSPPTTATSSPLTVSGTASDAGGISQVTWSNALTGQSGTATGTTNWSADIPLADGTNTITITVTDSAGNPTSQTFSVSYTAPVTPPTPTPTTPTPTSGGGKSHKRCGIGSSSPEPVSPAVVALAALLLALALRRQ